MAGWCLDKVLKYLMAYVCYMNNKFAMNKLFFI